MKRVLFILTLAAAVATAQDKTLTWDQLMDRDLYPQGKMTGFAFEAGGDRVAYRQESDYYLFDGKRATVISKAERDRLVGKSKGSQDGHRVKKEGGDLYVDGKLVERADGYNIVLGESVHRNEFGIDGGLFWSPEGRRLAFYRMDQSMVEDYPIVDTKRREAGVKNIKYPMAGMKSHEVTVGVWDTKTEKLVYLKSRMDTSVHEREMYLTNIAWSPDERHVYIAKVNREQNHMWLEQYDAATGERVKVLFEERDDRYVEPCEPMLFTPKGDQFVWHSMRDGYKHLYLYRADGTLVRQLTHGDYEVEGIIGFDKKGRHLFIYANKDNLIGRDAYRVSLDGSGMERLTAGKGTNTVVVNEAGTRMVCVRQSVQEPGVAYYQNIEPRRYPEPYYFYRLENPMKGYAQPKVMTGTLTAADGKTILYYRLIVPPSVDTSHAAMHARGVEKHPALVYVYGGPHSQLVTDSWMAGGNLYFMYLAQQGYVVFTLDNRGTDHRGFEFESCTHRQLGQLELADQMEGVEYLKALPFVDSERIGVEGWSFGGFMTITMKLAHPEVFKVACAGGPVIDWKWYEIMYGERYMDTPQENPDGYDASSLLDKAETLEGRLLVIHGAEDNTVVWQHSLEFIERCINSLKQVDYFVYPHHEHNVRGRERLHLYKKMFDYYETYLK